MTIHARLPPIRLLPQRRQLSDSAKTRNNFAFACRTPRFVRRQQT
jgi:hypothetical protein